MRGACRKRRGKAALLRHPPLQRQSWNKERCIAARIEATPNGLDIRYVVTSLNGTAKHLYETVYCGRGRCENFIK